MMRPGPQERRNLALRGEIIPSLHAQDVGKQGPPFLHQEFPPCVFRVNGKNMSPPQRGTDPFSPGHPEIRPAHIEISKRGVSPLTSFSAGDEGFSLFSPRHAQFFRAGYRGGATCLLMKPLSSFSLAFPRSSRRLSPRGRKDFPLVKPRSDADGPRDPPFNFSPPRTIFPVGTPLFALFTTNPFFFF